MFKIVLNWLSESFGLKRVIKTKQGLGIKKFGQRSNHFPLKVFSLYTGSKKVFTD